MNGRLDLSVAEVVLNKRIVDLIVDDDNVVVMLVGRGSIAWCMVNNDGIHGLTTTKNEHRSALPCVGDRAGE